MCIVQDNKEDVQSHLANMDVIYNNAELTIVITAADASSGISGYSSFARQETQVQYQVNKVELINTKSTFVETLENRP